MHSSKTTNIIIIGGSIAGCAIAALLNRIGFTVKILERSAQLNERGAGIVLPVQLLQQCVELDLFDANIPHISIDNRTFWVKESSDEPRSIWQQSIKLVALNWSTIYGNLHRRVPASCYHTGRELKAVINTKDRVIVESIAGKEECDLLIAADGVNSVTRHQLYPTATPNYAGYVAWRGTILMSEVDLAEQLKQNFHYFFPPDKHPGHLLIFPIPAANYQKTGQILINWMLYEAYSKEQLKSLLIDNIGKSQQISISRGALSKSHIDYLHSLANHFLPSKIAAIITQTKAPFLQAIFDSLVPQFVHERVCFIGDAGMTLRPHSGSGAGHALAFSIALAEVLKNRNTLPLNDILQQWNHGQLEYAQQQLLLSKNIGDALVMHAPLWSKMTHETMNQWWQSVIKGRYWHVTDNVAKNKKEMLKSNMMFLTVSSKEEKPLQGNSSLPKVCAQIKAKL